MKRAIILAGGKGTRLLPLTAVIPKPLVPIGNIPILEIVLLQLKHFGFTDITISVNHLAELITAAFGNGSKLGLNIRYSVEDYPLGTAGPLSLIDHLEGDFLVMNGDILTTLPFQDFYETHLNSKNDITIATYQKDLNIDLGVLEVDGRGIFQKYIEKPTYSFTVSMGIYMMNRSVLPLLKRGQRKDLPDLVTQAHDSHLKVAAYRGDYFWLDIGRRDDYETANEIFESRKGEFLRL